jgi:streptogramin lyase
MRRRYLFAPALIAAIIAASCAAHPTSNVELPGPPGLNRPASFATPDINQTGQSPGPWAFYANGETDRGYSSIAVGPNDTIWSMTLSSQIQVLAMDGAVQYVEVNTDQDVYGAAQAAVYGPDGRMWVDDPTEGQSDYGFFDAVTPAGVVTNYQVPLEFIYPDAIAVGSDGNLWATANNDILRCTTNGVITAYSLTAPRYLAGITAGPDGNLWFADDTDSMIGRITTGGSISEFAIVPSISPYVLQTGSDGNIYFTGEGNTPAIGAMTTQGAMINEWTVPFPDPPGVLWGLSQGPGADVWFSGTDKAGGYIGKFMRPNHWKLYSVPGTSSQPNGLVFGPDSNMWFGVIEGPIGNSLGAYLFNEITVSPKHVYFDPPKPLTRVITVKETPHGGTWNATSSNTSVVTVAPGPAHNQFTLTAVGRGGATVTVQDALLNSFVVDVNVINL